MATEDYWADPVIDRELTPLGRYFSTLDAVISKDDPVRLVDEVLAEVDWSDWEFYYPRKRGQPPIHPKHLAAAILYGMYRSIRSSRRLEEACNYRFDFLWLVEGRRIDHTTFSKFRSRFQTRTAKTPEQKLEALDELFDHLMTQFNAADAEEAGQGSPIQLPESLAEIEQRREQVKAALEQARSHDHPGPVRRGPPADGGEDGERVGACPLQPTSSDRGDDLWDFEVGDGYPSVFVAWIGEGEDRMALGGDGVQFDEIGTRDRETARRVGQTWRVGGGLRKGGRMRKSKVTERGPPKWRSNAAS